ncbi:MAG: GIY-YIG nuclease family protein [Spirochaetota bacterium]|jgi:putative endonuclease|nr:GIY-YIG nuclease family protein [Spirochaetota bacterium]
MEVLPLTAPWFVYLLRCADGSLYVGISNDVAHRIKTHNSGRGARYTRMRGPGGLAWQCYAGSQSRAIRLERLIKQCTHAQKEMLIAGELAYVLAQTHPSGRFFHL